MKTIFTTLILMASLSLSTAQVGINTEEPTATLDVNGSMRVRQSPVVNTVENVLTTDADGHIRQIPIESFNLRAINIEDAEFVPGISSSLNRSPVLDLWTIQESQGAEEIKRYYFLGQNVSVTLPKNISELGDKTARVITFVVVKNDAFGGTSISPWEAAFQTKLYEANSNTFDGDNGGVFLYENTFSGSGLTSGLNPVITEGNMGGYRRRVELRGQNSIRDREINFYDFGGKWIMTVND